MPFFFFAFITLNALIMSRSNLVLLDLTSDDAYNCLGYSPELMSEQLHKIIDMCKKSLDKYVSDAEVERLNDECLNDWMVKNDPSFKQTKIWEKLKSKYKTYLMTDSNTGFTKIGKSKNPSAREKTLQSQKPTINLFAILEEDREAEFHEFYNDQRVRGEWFDLSDEEIEALLNDFNWDIVR